MNHQISLKVYKMSSTLKINIPLKLSEVGLASIFQAFNLGGIIC